MAGKDELNLKKVQSICNSMNPTEKQLKDYAKLDDAQVKKLKSDGLIEEDKGRFSWVNKEPRTQLADEKPEPSAESKGKTDASVQKPCLAHSHHAPRTGLPEAVEQKVKPTKNVTVDPDTKQVINYLERRGPVTKSKITKALGVEIGHDNLNRILGNEDVFVYGRANSNESKAYSVRPDINVTVKAALKEKSGAKDLIVKGETDKKKKGGAKMPKKETIDDKAEKQEKLSPITVRGYEIPVKVLNLLTADQRTLLQTIASYGEQPYNTSKMAKELGYSPRGLSIAIGRLDSKLHGYKVKTSIKPIEQEVKGTTLEGTKKSKPGPAPKDYQPKAEIQDLEAAVATGLFAQNPGLKQQYLASLDAKEAYLKSELELCKAYRAAIKKAAK